MALERRNPLPAGVYWIDVANVKAAGLHAWRQANKATVRVAKTRVDSDLGFTWLLFEVSAPTPWSDARVYGYPNIAEQGIKTEFQPAFTPSKNVLDQLADATPSAGVMGKLFWLAAFGVGAFALIEALKVIKSKVD